MIREIAFLLETLKAICPELRVCQIIGNATGSNDPYYITDQELKEKLREYMLKITADGIANA